MRLPYLVDLLASLMSNNQILLIIYGDYTSLHFGGVNIWPNTFRYIYIDLKINAMFCNENCV